MIETGQGADPVGQTGLVDHEVDLEAAVDQEAVVRAVECLNQGGVVAFPTETSYGLGAAVDSPAALDRIYAIKNRPMEKPLLVIVDSPERMRGIVGSVPPAARRLMKRFWPGPLTILFPAAPGLPWPLHCGTGKIGVRISSNSWAHALSEMLSRPVTATSANMSGTLPAMSAGEVRKCLVDPAPDYILDGGGMAPGPASTIVDVTKADSQGRVYVVRHGVIPAEEVFATLLHPAVSIHVSF